MTGPEPLLPIVNVGFWEGISRDYMPAITSLATVRRGLICNLPSTIDPDQVVKVDPTATRFL